MVVLPSAPPLTRFIKPTLDTPFHIDYEWWARQELDLNIELLSHLCPEHRAAYSGQPLTNKIDWVDWITGEVKQVEGLQYIIAKHCSKEPGYIKQASTLVEAVFRVFLSSSNKPHTPRELALRLNYDPDQVLRVLSGRNVGKGIRPILPD